MVLLGYKHIAAISMDPEAPLNVLRTWFTARVTVTIADTGLRRRGRHLARSVAYRTLKLGRNRQPAASGTITDASRAQEPPLGRESLDPFARQQRFVSDASSYDDIVLECERLADLPLQPRDQVVVPAAEVFVTVLGEANRPCVIPLQYGLTVGDSIDPGP